MTLLPLLIKPMTYAKPQRIEASVRATELGYGLRMELGNVTTRYYADSDVPVGKVAVYAPPTYKAMPEYVGTLDSPEQPWGPGQAIAPAKPTFYLSFGSGYRRTEYAYDQMGESRTTNRHPVFPELIDGRGYVEVVATNEGRARYLARFYFKNQYSGLYSDTSMWDNWLERDTYYSGGPTEFLRENGSFVLGRLDEDGLRWGATHD